MGNKRGSSSLITTIAVVMTLTFCVSVWGADYKDSVTAMEFVFVKGGCFRMGESSGAGAENEKSAIKTCVSDYYIGKYEVTQGQWMTIMSKNPSIFKDCGDTCPVEGVSWDDAKEFTDLLSKRAGKNYRLPYEAEWEYAARSGGKDEKWAGTSDENTLKDYAWYRANSDKRPHPVGQKKPNGLGIYDMSGNVWEWMEDKLFEKYTLSPGSGQSGTWEYCILRGGSWNDSPEGLRFVSHNVSRAIETDLSLGFRVALPVR